MLAAAGKWDDTQFKPDEIEPGLQRAERALALAEEMGAPDLAVRSRLLLTYCRLEQAGYRLIAELQDRTPAGAARIVAVSDPIGLALGQGGTARPIETLIAEAVAGAGDLATALVADGRPIHAGGGTEAPITTPSMVRKERILCAVSARSATRSTIISLRIVLLLLADPSARR